LIKQLLERTGKYEVMVVNHAPASIEAARSFRPHLILLDVIMPEMDGPDVVRALRADPELKDIPLALLTTLFSRSEPFDPNLLTNGVSTLGKPPTEGELVALIEARTA